MQNLSLVSGHLTSLVRDLSFMIQMNISVKYVDTFVDLARYFQGELLAKIN